MAFRTKATVAFAALALALGSGGAAMAQGTGEQSGRFGAGAAPQSHAAPLYGAPTSRFRSRP